MNFPIKYFKAGIITAILLMIFTGFVVGLFAIARWKNDSKLTDAQTKYWERQAEQVGKPTVVEQRHIYENLGGSE